MDHTNILISTSFGDIKLKLLDSKAPLAVEKFLDNIKNNVYSNASLYRVANSNNDSKIDVIQGGILKSEITQSIADYSEGFNLKNGVNHETTTETGQKNIKSTISFARLEVGSANTEFFFNLSDNPSLDTGYTLDGRDGHGYTAFGKVISGLEILEKIKTKQTTKETNIDIVKNQILDEPIIIKEIKVL